MTKILYMHALTIHDTLKNKNQKQLHHEKGVVVSAAGAQLSAAAQAGIEKEAVAARAGS
jgi:hypothetical protein